MDAVGNTASIFHIIFHCFIHAQLAREFEDEFKRHQLRLDILQIRLSRWVETLETIDPVKNGSSSLTMNENTSNLQERTISEILAAIQEALSKAQRDATRMKVHLSLAAGTSSSTASSVQPLDPAGCAPFGQPKKRLRAVLFFDRRRAQTAKAIGGIKWAFYKRNHFDRIIADVAALVADLESLLINQDQASGRPKNREWDNFEHTTAKLHAHRNTIQSI